MRQKQQFHSGKDISLEKNIDRPLSSRQRLFVEELAANGWNRALAISRYSRAQVYRLMHDPRVKKYYTETAERLLNKLGISPTSILKKYYDMGVDENVPCKERRLILEHLLDIIIAEEEEK
ncbi:MAG: hypothetical protein ACFFFT_11245 [Candidatus Thorarchaeota archaeon]